MKPFAQQTYYELLEVPPSATDTEIRAAHQRLMELYSPDSIAVYALGDPDQVEALRERMNEAMEMLTDADLRVEYDRSIGLSTERLAKAVATAEAVGAVDSAARVAEALATAAAALAKAAGAVDAERLEAESRLKAAASVNDNEGEASRASGTPGKSEERMRGEESKRQESSGKDAPGVPPEPVMVGGVAVVEAFRASFTRSLSFVYVPASPLRGQGRGAAEAPAPAVDAKSPGAETAPAASAPKAEASGPVEPAATAAASQVEALPPTGSASVPASPVVEPAAAAAPDRVETLMAPVASTATEVPAPQPATGTHAVAAPVAAPSAPEASASPVEPVAAPPAPGASASPVEAVATTTAPEASASPVEPVTAPPASEASATPAASVAAPPAPEAGATPAVPVGATPVPDAVAATPAQESSATPQVPEAGSVASSPAPVADASAVTTTQGESDPNPTLDSSTTALARVPATGASRAAVRPLTSRPIDSRPAQNGPTGPGSVKGPTVRKLGDAQVLAQDSAIATAESALAQVAAKVREARPRGVDIPSDAEFNGELLRRVREARGLTIQQLADRTRISVRHLENVEADRYTALPTTVYLRGILMNLARELGLDPLRVSKSYLALFSEKPAKSGR
ncbi:MULTISPECIES: helix-turn-helix domain-containing protein [unclassified Corallococcus]|uniref:helix-turn-helix domain-containing protein n=1 Tax=unclassified Corallococcus TaxID=2685029 RepID=UPI001A8EDA84|nr:MULTISPECIES: helix-turn-helix domain-containing protein [unclassified Corallococcus]MBN9686113.1 helix-turn-helix domain-containing protein [Corallococcus sp. NCSPR001]WAS82452.1 helix-turn-helix domain-containing protein [Corallococcus sp. NCRR]